MAKTTTGKVSFSNRTKGKTAIATTKSSAKLSTMNKTDVEALKLTEVRADN